ncbi:conserved hypothetical protein [Frankia sp. AiPs1]
MGPRRDTGGGAGSPRRQPRARRRVSAGGRESGPCRYPPGHPAPRATGQDRLAFGLAETAPHAVGLTGGQRVLAARADDRAAGADRLRRGFAGRPSGPTFSFRMEEQLGTLSPTGAVKLPLPLLRAGAGKSSDVGHRPEPPFRPERRLPRAHRSTGHPLGDLENFTQGTRRQLRSVVPSRRAVVSAGGRIVGVPGPVPCSAGLPEGGTDLAGYGAGPDGRSESFRSRPAVSYLADRFHLPDRPMPADPGRSQADRAWCRTCRICRTGGQLSWTMHRLPRTCPGHTDQDLGGVLAGSRRRQRRPGPAGRAEAADRHILQ